ncbi:MAG TPA: orotate phosphoribosyltransferase [Gammaproteobacteria bacterium]|nr:orotate phosphoribosyltransferase [Gammaproteobacteria bacterium]
MKAYKSEFLDLALELEVIRFGEFTLKSGRVSPYFFNAGEFNTGYAAAKLARCYAAAIVDLDVEFDVLFGPAYKGIPLVVLAAAALAEHHDLDYPFAFNRKEVKDHGEGGSIVGASLSGKRALIVDDVITAGTAIKQVASIIGEAGGTPAGVLVALDREEIGTRARIPAKEQLEAEIGLKLMSIVSLTDFVEHLEESEDYAAHLPAVKAYRNRYGVALDN